MRRMTKLLSFLLAFLMLCGTLPYVETEVEAASYITNLSALSGSDYTDSPALAAALDVVFAGDIDIYSNSSCTTEQNMPVGTSPVKKGAQFWVKSKTSGNTVSGWQCYIYGNAVYNKLFNEWVGHGAPFSHSQNVITPGVNSVSYEMFRDAGVRTGAYVRTTANSDGSYHSSVAHSFIILKYDANSITYLEGNADGNGLIRVTTRNWSEFNTNQLSGRGRYICHVVQPTAEYYSSLYPSADKEGPTFTCGASNDLSTQQTVIMDIKDESALAGYYWGNDTDYTKNQFVSTSEIQIVKTITEPGNYYFTSMDVHGNVSQSFGVCYKKTTFDANGGNVSVPYTLNGPEVTVDLPIPTKDGYVFRGWATSADASEGFMTYFTPNDNTTLYAVWESNDKDKPIISFVASTQELSTEQTIIVRTQDNSPLAGYYWGTNEVYSNNPFTSSDATELVATLSEPGNYCFVAVDIHGNTSDPYVFYFRKTTLDANGGTVSIPYTLNGPTMTVDLPVPEREGYTFAGWANAVGDIVETTPYTTPQESCVLYAVWEKNDTIMQCGDSIAATFDETSGTLTLDGDGKMWDYLGDLGLPWIDFCDEIKSVVISEGITKVGEGAFQGCQNLSNVTIPQSIEIIGYAAFAYCKNLKAISIPIGVKTIGDSAFCGTGLTTIALPEGVVEVSAYAFESCKSLKTVYLPKTIEVIGYGVIENSMVSDIYYAGTENDWTKIKIGDEIFGMDDSFKQATVHYAVPEVVDYGVELHVSDAQATAGETVTVDIVLDKNVGFTYLNLLLDYDATAMELVSVSNGTIVNSLTQGRSYIWAQADNATATGVLATLTFAVKEDASAGDYAVTAEVIECCNEQELDVTVGTADGKITVIDFVYGDCNGDNAIDGKDVTRLLRYLANYDPVSGTSGIEISRGADVTGDGAVNGKDATRLLRYLANYDPVTGESSVELG